MRLSKVMEKDGENLAVSFGGSLLGLLIYLDPQLTAAVGQVATSLVTMVVGAVLLRFVRLGLDRRLPLKKRRKETPESEEETAD